MNIAQDFAESRVPTEDNDDNVVPNQLQDEAEEVKGDETSGAAEDNSGSSNLSEEKKAEAERQKKIKEESKEREESEENFRKMKEQINTTRNMRRRETVSFIDANQQELWTPNELTPIQEEIDQT